MLDRKNAPHITDPVDFDLHLKSVAVAELKNNTPVYSIDAGAEEVMSLELLFEAGSALESKPQVAVAVNNLIKNGTSKKSAYEIAETVDFFGAYLNTSCSTEYSSITISCLSKQLPNLLPLLVELLTDSQFPEQELDIYKQNSLQRLEMNLKKGEFVAGQLIDAYAYGPYHPYGKYTHKEDLAALNRQDLLSFYKGHYTNGRVKIFVAGRLPTDIFALLNDSLGSLPFNQASSLLTTIDYEHDPDKEKVHTVTNDKGSVQGAIRLERLMPGRKSPDWSALTVLNTVFGGYFGSRLMSNIREDKGYTYGIHSYLQGHLHESAWVVSTEAGRDVCPDTIKEVWKEADLLRTTLIDPEELLLVKNYVVGSVLGTLDGPFQIINRWKSYILHDLPKDHFDRHMEVVKSVSAASLKELAGKYLDESLFYQLTVY
ncbi:Predicted Zn-dependent peptidase [Arachidicoccus rhizosphaerae]|uniref:Predicted Zn-dependent peptidase n=1 Tax=Arachidicoccus rhizosphaerae TaxID=551991 RepID=A0A1H3X0Z0_9BACT|nr:pitrilysin family protein [Arachidicoccus rhizosphaerae]SDZ92188.1 Predicted Zn-dependent peptidase [Arachidicoccus rhizosphaerae]